MRGALIAALLLAGCASMDKGECVNANWYAIGLEDGAQGRGLERLGAHRRACAEHKVSPDGERYAAGHSEGLKSFCTYERGYALGRGGKAAGATCPPGLREDFLAGYGRGRELHELQRRLDQVNGDIRKTKAGLSEPGVSPRTRSQLAERLEGLSREAAQLEQEMARQSQR
jgi:uncharacterized protein DUF2799